MFSMVGTVAFMAPEIITKNRDSGHGRMADIWRWVSETLGWTKTSCYDPISINHHHSKCLVVETCNLAGQGLREYFLGSKCDFRYFTRKLMKEICIRWMSLENMYTSTDPVKNICFIFSVSVAWWLKCAPEVGRGTTWRITTRSCSKWAWEPNRRCPKMPPRNWRISWTTASNSIPRIDGRRINCSIILSRKFTPNPIEDIPKGKRWLLYH